MGSLCVFVEGGWTRSGDLLFNVVCSLLTHTSTPALSKAHALLFAVRIAPLPRAAHTLSQRLSQNPMHACTFSSARMPRSSVAPTTACRAPPPPPPHRCGMHALTHTTSATCTFPPFKHACPTSTQSPPLPAVSPAHPHYSLPLMLGEERAGAMASGHHAVCTRPPPPNHPPTTRKCVF